MNFCFFISSELANIKLTLLSLLQNLLSNLPAKFWQPDQLIYQIFDNINKQFPIQHNFSVKIVSLIPFALNNMQNRGKIFKSHLAFYFLKKFIKSNFVCLFFLFHLIIYLIFKNNNNNNNNNNDNNNNNNIK